VIQADRNIVLSLLAFNKEQRQNDTCAGSYHQMENIQFQYIFASREIRRLDDGARRAGAIREATELGSQRVSDRRNVVGRFQAGRGEDPGYQGIADASERQVINA